MNYRASPLQLRLERSACLKMALFELLSAAVFLFNPNPSAFARLAANGFGAAPEILGLFNFICALVYMFLASPKAFDNLSKPVRSILFFGASFPVLAYLLPLGIIFLTLGMSIVGLVYFFEFGVIVMVTACVFYGGTRNREWVVLGGMAAFMFVCAYIFINVPGTVPSTIRFPVPVLVALSIAGGVSYVMMLAGVGKNLSFNLRRLWFFCSEAVLPVYAAISLISSLFFGAGIYPSVSIFDLYLLIALFPYVLFERNYAPARESHSL